MTAKKRTSSPRTKKQQQQPAEEVAAEAVVAVPGFLDLGLAPELVQSVQRRGTRPRRRFSGRDSARAHGRDLMGLAQTGTGKTAAFTLPIIQRLIGGPRRTVADPDADARAVPAGGGELPEVRTARGPRRRAGVRRRAVRAAGEGAAPRRRRGRRDAGAAASTTREAERRRSTTLEVLVLDEADRMLDMGFAPQINRIVSADPEVPADAALQRDDAAGSRGARAKVSAQARSWCRSAAARRRRAR